MSIIDYGYKIGLFVQEMDKAEAERDLWGIIKAARNFMPHAQEMETELINQRKEEIENERLTRTYPLRAIPD